MAIRLPDYHRIPAIILARSRADVLETIRRGRIRYVVTGGDFPGRPEEAALLDATCASSPQDFVLLRRLPLLVEYEKPGWRGEVFIWQFKGALPAGRSELWTPIPTAHLSVAPPF